MGKGMFLLAWIVLRRPGIRVVLATWKSRVLGLAMWTATFDKSASMSFRSREPTSSLEHRLVGAKEK